MHRFWKTPSEIKPQNQASPDPEFIFGKGFVPNRKQLPSAIIIAHSVDQVALDSLRERQRELKLFDSEGYLYDPAEKYWVAPNVWIEGLHDNLNYFQDWPEMLKGLPAGSERVDDPDDDYEMVMASSEISKKS